MSLSKLPGTSSHRPGITPSNHHSVLLRPTCGSRKHNQSSSWRSFIASPLWRHIFGSEDIRCPPSFISCFWIRGHKVVQFARVNLCVLGEVHSPVKDRVRYLSCSELTVLPYQLSLHCSVLTYGSAALTPVNPDHIWRHAQEMPKKLPPEKVKKRLRLKKVSHERYDVTVRRVSSDNIDSAPPRAIMEPINHLIKEHSMTL